MTVKTNFKRQKYELSKKTMGSCSTSDSEVIIQNLDLKKLNKHICGFRLTFTDYLEDMCVYTKNPNTYFRK
jgi:hypothetical protein